MSDRAGALNTRWLLMVLIVSLLALGAGFLTGVWLGS